MTEMNILELKTKIVNTLIDNQNSKNKAANQALATLCDQFLNGCNTHKSKELQTAINKLNRSDTNTLEIIKQAQNSIRILHIREENKLKKGTPRQYTTSLETQWATLKKQNQASSTHLPRPIYSPQPESETKKTLLGMGFTEASINAVLECEPDSNFDTIVNTLLLNSDTMPNALPKTKDQIKDQFLPTDDPAGLPNAGSTCFGNAVLQSMFSTNKINTDTKLPKITVTEDSSINDLNKHGAYLLQELQRQRSSDSTNQEKRNELLADLWATCQQKSNQEPGLTPFSVLRQQDSHEFFLSYIDPMLKHCSNEKKFNVTIEGTTEKRTFKTTEKEIITHLELQNYSPTTRVLTMQAIIDINLRGIREQKLQPSDKQDTKVNTKLSFNNLPDRLTIPINRTRFEASDTPLLTTRQYKAIKDKSPIKFDEIVLMNGLNPKRYTFKGAIVHTGTPNSGHYVYIEKIEAGYRVYNDGRVNDITGSADITEIECDIAKFSKEVFYRSKP